jgi:hypothetical protein
MTRSFRRLTVSALAAAFALFAVAAHAGIEPSPFKVVLVNRSNTLPGSSTYFGQTIQTADLELQARTASGDIVQLRIPLADEVLPGQTWVAIADPGNAAGNVTLVSILTWRITARMGVEPSPFRVYALDSRAATIADPGDAPWLPVALLSEQMSLYAFSSPGTLIGSATLATDLFYDACPLTDPWKNHGQYVRCVAFHAEELLSQGLINQEAADAAVSAAARSTVGK